MEFGFRERPDDLILAAGLPLAVLALVALGVAGIPRIALSVLAVIVAPGYAVIAALFPAAGGIDWTRRITLSIVVSLAAVPPAALLANSMPWGPRIEGVLALLSLVTIVACIFAYRRRQALAANERLSLTLRIRGVSWGNASSSERFLVLGLVAALVAASALFVIAGPRPPPPGFTEFAVLNETGIPGGYPTNLSVGEEGAVILVVASHESATVNYTIEIWLATLDWVFNQTSGRNETVETANVSLLNMTVTVDPGAEERIPYQIRVDQPGEYRLKFLLYKGPPGPDPYRSLGLLITVT